MPARLSSARKKTGSGKKGKSKPAKVGPVDPHHEQIAGLIREREEIRSKLNTVCSKIIEQIHLDDYQKEIDLTKQQPSDVPLKHLLSMIDKVCSYRVAFLHLYQEVDDNENIPVQQRITQLAIDEPDMFRKRLSADQRLTFVTRERNVWRDNARILQSMYTNLVDQVDIGLFNKFSTKSDEMLRRHQLNLSNIDVTFSSPRVRSINTAKKLVGDDLDSVRDQRAVADLAKIGALPSIGSSSTRHPSLTSIRRSVSFADKVNVLNGDGEIDLHPFVTSDLPTQVSTASRDIEENVYSLTPAADMVSNLDLFQGKLTDSDYHSFSSSSFTDLRPTSPKYHLPLKYRRPLGSDVSVNKMDANLRMLIIKELSKNGHADSPFSRMSSTDPNPLTRESREAMRARTNLTNESSDWVKLARLIGIDQSEIDHWLSQNLQYPAGRVLSAWSNCSSVPLTVARLHSLVSSDEVNRPDLARYIETVYIID